MDAGIVLTVASLAMAAGVWGIVLVRRKNGNGHTPPPAPTVTVTPTVREDPQLLEKLDELPQQIRESLADVHHSLMRINALMEHQLQKPEPPPPPPPPEPSWPADLQHSIQQLGDDLKVHVDQLVAASENDVKLDQLIQKMDRVAEHIAGMLSEERRRAGIPSPPDLRAFVSPVPRAGPVNLDIYNTLVFVEDLIYELIPPEKDVFLVSVLNLGPAMMYMRADAPPTGPGDPHATSIPAGAGDNLIHVPRSIFVLCDKGGSTVAARLSWMSNI